jgi:hypothetical protein
LNSLTYKEIELCEEGEDAPDLSKSDKSKSSGVKYEYLAPVNQEPTQQEASVDTSSVDLNDLMSKLKSL